MGVYGNLNEFEGHHAWGSFSAEWCKVMLWQSKNADEKKRLFQKMWSIYREWQLHENLGLQHELRNTVQLSKLNMFSQNSEVLKWLIIKGDKEVSLTEM